MKRAILTSAICICLTNFLFAQNTSSGSMSESQPFRIGFFAQPLGFVQFGPVAGTEITFVERLSFEGHVRFAKYGLLSYVVASNADGGIPDKLSGIAYGGAFKYMIPSRIGGFYIGPLVEYGWQNQTYKQTETFAWESKATYFAAAVTAGYKFRFKSGFYMNTGLYLGAYHTLTDKSHKIKTSPNSYTSNYLRTLPFGMLEVSLGYELKLGK
jgi:hypothetical protein